MEQNTENKDSTPQFGNTVLGVMHWDTELEYAGLPSNMVFSFGSEFGDIIYRLQKQNDNTRWCIFSADRNYYIIKQHEINNKWFEVWTKQMNKDLLGAKKYCEEDYLQHYTS